MDVATIDFWERRVGSLAERAVADPAVSVPLATAGLMADLRMQTTDQTRPVLLVGLATRVGGMLAASAGRRRDLLEAFDVRVRTAAGAAASAS